VKAPTGRPTEKDDEMRFMLIQNYGETESQCPPMFEWAVADIEAHVAFQLTLNEELTRLGELIDAQGLAGPEDAKFVVSDGTAPVVTDGPFPETKELIAGYRVVEVDTLDRAIEIAAQLSAAPGPEGTPIQAHIEVRQVMGPPPTDG
jgi:hypothetical protein